MSYDTVLTAVQNLLKTQVSDLGLITRQGSALESFDPNLTSEAILRVAENPPPVERRLGMGKGGHKIFTWWLDTTIWMYSAQTTDGSETTWLALLKAVHDAYDAAYPNLSGAADLPGDTWVMVFGDQYRGPIDQPWQLQNGYYARPALLSVQVVEEIAA